LADQGARSKNEDFGVVAAAQDETVFVGQQCGIAGMQDMAIDGEAAAHQVHVGLARRVKRQRGGFAAGEKARVERGVGMDGHRAPGAVGRGDQAQAATLFGCREGLLLVARGNACFARFDPDLQEVGGRIGRLVELAVPDAASGAHALHVARRNDRAVAHAVLVRQQAGGDIGDDLHVAMAVHAEAAAGSNQVVVDDA
jgi:hypothetical protein